MDVTRPLAICEHDNVLVAGGPDGTVIDRMVITFPCGCQFVGRGTMREEPQPIPPSIWSQVSKRVDWTARS